MAKIEGKTSQQREAGRAGGACTSNIKTQKNTLPSAILADLCAMRPSLALLTTLFFISSTAGLQVCITPDAGFNMLTNGVTTAEVTSDKQVKGYDRDMREEIFTNRLGIPYTVRALGSYGEVQVRTRAGECDVGWAPFYLTGQRERCTLDATSCLALTPTVLNELAAGVGSWEKYRCCVDGSMEYLPWTVAVLYKAQASTSFFVSVFTILVEPFFINYLSFLFIFVVVFGHLAWLAERHANSEQFPKGYVEGVDDGIWWAATTVTTVGYGDKSPVTPAGRLVALVWMFSGVAMVSILTGHMANRFAVLSNSGDIKSAEDLRGFRVCGYASTFSQQWAAGVRMVEVIGADISECGELLRRSEVDAVVMDTPIMAYYRMTEPWCKEQKLHISPPLAQTPIGLSFPEVGVLAADHRQAINAALLDYFGSAGHTLLEAKWFPKSSASASGDTSSLQMSMVIPSALMILLYSGVQVARVVWKRHLARPSNRPAPKQSIGESIDPSLATQHA